MSENKMNKEEEKKIYNIESISLKTSSTFSEVYREVKKLVSRFAEYPLLREKIEYIKKDIDDMERIIGEMWALHEILLCRFEADVVFIKRQFYKQVGDSFILRFDEDAVRLYTPSMFHVTTIFYDELEKETLDKFIIEAFTDPYLLSRYTEHVKRKIMHILYLLQENLDFLSDIRKLAKWLESNNQI